MSDVVVVSETAVEVVTELGQPDVVIETEEEFFIITEAIQGPEGPSAAQSYQHVQVTPQLVWTVQHNLGYRPAGVSVTDDQGRRRQPDTHHVNVNLMTLTFAEPTPGYADLS